MAWLPSERFIGASGGVNETTQSQIGERKMRPRVSVRWNLADHFRELVGSGLELTVQDESQAEFLPGRC